MMKGVPNYLVTVLVLALACCLASAYDPSPLQDFCISTNDYASGGMKSFEAFVHNIVFLLDSFYIPAFPSLRSICEWKVLQGLQACLWQ
jgi:hypothetical protein